MPDDLTFNRGEALRAGQMRAFVALIQDVRRGQLLPGPGMALQQYPDGVIPRMQVQAVTRTAHAFKVSAEEVGDGIVFVRFGFGMVQGIEPTIDGKPISAIGPDGETPALKVPPDAFSPHGVQERALIYFRYTINSAWRIGKVEPIAASKRPAPEGCWHKLVATLVREDRDSSVDVRQAIVFNQGFAASEQKDNGHFTAWPWAEA